MTPPEGAWRDHDPSTETTVSIGELTLEDAAREASGNWQRWKCFVWFRESEIADPRNWSIVYTRNRDSGLLDQSNADAIAEVLEPFTEGDDPDVVLESHSHWAVGWVAGFSIRVYRDGQITDAFRSYQDLCERLADCPILDDEDYSERELEATLDNIGDSGWKLKHEFNLPDGWEGDVYSWLSDHRPGSVENKDDQGGYPAEDDLREAFDALGFERVEN
jgi:hypothetical protein